MKALRWGLPLAIFGVLVVFLFVGLYRDPREVPSPLIDKPAPAFRLADLAQPARQVGTDDFKVFVQCEETAMPVPFRLGKENGKWLFRSI